MNVFSFSSPTKKTNNENNVTHHVKLGKKTRESSKRNYYIVSPGPRVMLRQMREDALCKGACCIFAMEYAPLHSVACVLMMIVFITFNSSLVPLFEGL